MQKSIVLVITSNSLYDLTKKKYRIRICNSCRVLREGTLFSCRAFSRLSRKEKISTSDVCAEVIVSYYLANLLP